MMNGDAFVSAREEAVSLVSSGSNGFVFTLDSMVGAAVIAFVIVTFTFTVQQPTRNDVVLDRMAADALVVLEERGTIATEDASTINDTLREVLPSEVDYNFRVDYFDVSGSTLSFDKTISVDNVPGDDDIIFAQRPVPILVNESVSSSIKDTSSIAKVRLGVSL